MVCGAAVRGIKRIRQKPPAAADRIRCDGCALRFFYSCKKRTRAKPQRYKSRSPAGKCGLKWREDHRRTWRVQCIPRAKRGLKRLSQTKSAVCSSSLPAKKACANSRRSRAHSFSADKRGGSASPAGSRTVKTLPLPSVLSARILPPCAAAMAAAIVSPMPEPPVSRLRDASAR